MAMYRVAVRPTADEIKTHRLYYEGGYYEDRAKTIEADSEQEAVQKYIKDDRATSDMPWCGIKVGDRMFLTAPEEPYVRARLV